MRQRVVSTALLCLWLSSCAYPQSMRIGEPFPFDKVPPKLGGLIKGAKGKSIIVDFFSSGCTVCFASLPKLKEMQDEFSESLTFILVGKTDRYIETTYRRFESRYALKFAVLYDSNLFKSTGKETFPTYLWIDKNGIVKKITGASYVTKANISSFIGLADSLSSATKKLTSQPVAVQSLVFKTKISPSVETEPSVLPGTLPVTASELQLSRAKLKQLLFYAYFAKTYWSSVDSMYDSKYSEIILEDSSLKHTLDDPQRYTYQFSSSIEINRTSIQKRMQADINDAFPFYAQMERRSVPYWSLTFTGSDTNSIKTKFQVSSRKWTLTEVSIRAMPISALVELFTFYFPTGPIFVDNTGVKGLVDLDFQANLFDMEQIQKGLVAHGLKFERKFRDMDAIVVYKKGAPLIQPVLRRP